MKNYSTKSRKKLRATSVSHIQGEIISLTLLTTKHYIKITSRLDWKPVRTFCVILNINLQDVKGFKHWRVLISLTFLLRSVFLFIFLFLSLLYFCTWATGATLVPPRPISPTAGGCSFRRPITRRLRHSHSPASARRRGTGTPTCPPVHHLNGKRGWSAGALVLSGGAPPCTATAFSSLIAYSECFKGH